MGHKSIQLAFANKYFQNFVTVLLSVILIVLCLYFLFPEPRALARDKQYFHDNVKVSATNLRQIVYYMPIFSSEKVLGTRERNEHKVLGNYLYNIVARYQWLTGDSSISLSLAPLYRDKYEVGAIIPFWLAGHWDMEFPVVHNTSKHLSRHSLPFSCTELFASIQCSTEDLLGALEEIESDAYLLAKATHKHQLGSDENQSYYQRALDRAHAIIEEVNLRISDPTETLEQ